MSGIYIHIPFCKQACHYCDFHFSTSTKKKNEMLLAICNELKLRKTEVHPSEIIQTIYFGGGTPSILSVAELNSIMDTIDQNYQVAIDAEITVEANPDDLTNQKIKALANSPINRLSIGVQSFFEEDLKFMNRAHNAEEARKCIFTAQHYFDNISIDLIYGIPGMTTNRWKENLKIASDFEIPHISSYALTVEPNTALASFIKKGIMPPVQDELAQEHFEVLINTMETLGLEHYEFSNFGKPGYCSKNNTAYWQGKKYMGIGPSAHSYNGKERSWNIANNNLYIKSIQENKLPKETENLSTTDRYNEYVMTGLRTMWGVSLERIQIDFGNTYKEYLLKQAQKHIDEHLLYIQEDTLLVTKKGKFLSDGIASDLFLLNLE